MLFESSTAFFYVRGHVEAAIDLSLVAAPELFVPFVLLLIEADEQTEDIRQFQIEARAAAEIPWLEDSAVEDHEWGNRPSDSQFAQIIL